MAAKLKILASSLATILITFLTDHFMEESSYMWTLCMWQREKYQVKKDPSTNHFHPTNWPMWTYDLAMCPFYQVTFFLLSLVPKALYQKLQFTLTHEDETCLFLQTKKNTLQQEIWCCSNPVHTRDKHGNSHFDKDWW